MCRSRSRVCVVKIYNLNNTWKKYKWRRHFKAAVQKCTLLHNLNVKIADEVEVFYLNSIELLFHFVELYDQLEVCLPCSRLSTRIPMLAVFQNLRWSNNKMTLWLFIFLSVWRIFSALKVWLDNWILLISTYPFHEELYWILEFDQQRLSHAAVSEWLRSWTRNPMGYARAGSNPAVCVKFYFIFVLVK